MKNPFKKPNIETRFYDDAYFGFRDAESGYYDEYYLSRKDGGKRYNEGIQEALKQGATIKHYIKDTY